jgi:hypothetical protein
MDDLFHTQDVIPKIASFGQRQVLIMFPEPQAAFAIQFGLSTPPIRSKITRYF